MEKIRCVVRERGFAVAVANDRAQAACLLRALERELERTVGAVDQREVVQRGDARDVVGARGGELETPFRMRARRRLVAAAACEDAEDVVRLGGCAIVLGTG